MHELLSSTKKLNTNGEFAKRKSDKIITCEQYDILKRNNRENLTMSP